MNFYEAVVNYKKLQTSEENESRALFPCEGENKPHKFLISAFEYVNKNLGVNCDEKDSYSIFFWDVTEGTAKVIFSVNMNISDVAGATAYIKDFLTKNYDVTGVEVTEIKEITKGRFEQLGNRGEENELIRRFRGDVHDLHISFGNNCEYKIKEEMIPDEKLSLDEAKKRAKMLLADKSFYEELERIYSDENEKKFYGNPVQYKISASNMDVAMEIAGLLGQALKANCRLNGSRICKITDITPRCYDEDDIEDLFSSADGNIVLMDLSGDSCEHGNYANEYEDVINYIDRIIRKNYVKTLCIFVENTSHRGFADKLLSKIGIDIDIVELKEGRGTREETEDYILRLAENSGYKTTLEEIDEILPEKKIFTISEAYEVYNKWFKNGLKNKIYKAYKYCSCLEIKNDDKKSEPYEELQKMIGLSEIKKVVDEIIDSAKIQKMRSEMGLDAYKTSLHMVFTGNPGSAKTTVARLLAQILTKEGILETGRYVECGRADLVAKYVGWTARTVKEKFLEACGGVLFIDEAYSLVDGSNSFGDEAINTIVQEMENYRDKVVVIFAGYPDKMKEFLDKNEGLRSRIAFHLDFPDYNAEELVKILKLTAEKKGYRLDAGTMEKCNDIFEKIVTKKDFGNGRYARNLLEQAMMAQARRISTEYKGKKVTKRILSTLKAEDFDVNAGEQAEKEKKNPIGFAV